MGTKTIKIGIFILAIGMLAACKEHSPEKISRSIPSTLQQPITKLRLGLAAFHPYDQKMILKEMRDQLGPETYDTLLSSEFSAYAQKWYKKVELAFAQDTLLFHEIWFALGEHNQAKSMLQQVPRPNCNCEMNAWFQCPVLPQLQNCKPIPCTRIPCGPLLWWNCNGMCD
ncbi:bacteriocin fulvocin C-related protein [Ulvibacterium marinum]|uniref:bacteriocin fulvocin C-related protein n=1 Tax=Ulvibacterium marinum TaxID=2419782 RepID=UPI002495253E|nr:bacteriocin fulvocin C-related protein [Ulvibacterium marinum]